MPINIINNIIDIFSYYLALFVCEYLSINRFELAFKKLNILKKLEHSILLGNIIQLDRSIDKQAGIGLIIIRK